MRERLRHRSARYAGSVARFVAALAIALAGIGRASAQDQPTEFQSWQLPGWTFTPGIIFGTLYDSNVAIAFPDATTQSTASDKLLEYQPFGQLEYLSPRTTFSSGYQGFLRRYFELNDLDGTDHRAFASVRDRVTRRVTVFFNDNYLRVPTTDQLELNGIPFQRTGAQYNTFSGGTEARLSRTNDLSVRYELTWVDFVRKDTLLTGGLVHGVLTSVSHRFTDRASLGAEYGLRLADLTGATRQLRFQDTGGVFRYQTGPDVTLEAAAGISHLDDRDRGTTRTGPYLRAGLTDHARRATIGVEYQRSYVPSFAFGGSNQSSELSGYVQMPLSRKRVYVQESAAWRRTNPLVLEELPLDSIWLHTVVGFPVQRWFRIEGYDSFSRQDTRLAGGQINRHLIGVQVVVSEPVRIR
jgi:hypothetical protein